MHSKVVKSISIILMCSIVAKILSYAWEAILAYFLGASDQADAVYMTTSIFGVLYPIIPSENVDYITEAFSYCHNVIDRIPNTTTNTEN